MTKLCYDTLELVTAKSGFALEALKEMSNRTTPMLALIAVISLSLTGCGGGGTASSSTSSQTNHTATGHPTGMAGRYEFRSSALRIFRSSHENIPGVCAGSVL